MSASNVYARGWVPHTCIAMSSTVRLFSKNGRSGNYTQIGVVQSFRPADTRRMERARGIGFGDRVAEIVPGTTDVAITVTRMALYDENILEALGYHSSWNTGGVRGSVRSLSHMKNPFDINEVIVFHARQGTAGLQGFQGGNEFIGGPTNEFTSFWYHDCWVNSWTRTIDITGNLIYMEDVGIDVTWVSDGKEPEPYQDTDVWDTHGLGCRTNGFSTTSTFAELNTSPPGQAGLNPGQAAAVSSATSAPGSQRGFSNASSGHSSQGPGANTPGEFTGTFINI